jgi:hypothetical protein
MGLEIFGELQLHEHLVPVRMSTALVTLDLMQQKLQPCHLHIVSFMLLFCATDYECLSATIFIHLHPVCMSCTFALAFILLPGVL